MDAGEPPLSASATVALSVTDINDNPPVLDQPSYCFAVAENEPAGSHVGDLTVSDSDEHAAANISFSLEGPHRDR